MRNEVTVTKYIRTALLDSNIELPHVSSTICSTNMCNQNDAQQEVFDRLSNDPIDHWFEEAVATEP